MSICCHFHLLDPRQTTACWQTEALTCSLREWASRQFPPTLWWPRQRGEPGRAKRIMLLGWRNFSTSNGKELPGILLPQTIFRSSNSTSDLQVKKNMYLAGANVTALGFYFAAWLKNCAYQELQIAERQFGEMIIWLDNFIARSLIDWSWVLVQRACALLK